MENKLNLILQKIETLEANINGIKNYLSELKGTTGRIESKQPIIYEHTAKLSEYHTDIKHELEDVKDHIQFNTHKITENEREI